MKKTLADQVRDYIAFMGDGFTAGKLALEVARLQRDLPEKQRCKRQNIEQLLERDFRTVRYVPALAAAMGTSVETLVAGAFVPGSSQMSAPTTAQAPAPGMPAPPTLAQALEVVAAALQHADELTLIQARPLLQRLAEQPQEASRIAPRLLALLDGSPLSTETSDFAKKKQTAE